MAKALILDLDNTLYSWMDAYADSFREQIHFLCDTLNIEESLILRDFKSVFKKYDSVEVPNAVYQLALWNTCDISENRRIQIQDESLEAFLRGWKKNIKLFPKVKETLEWAHKMGYRIIAYSDAFAFWVDFRLRALNIMDYFDDIYAMENDRIADSSIVLNSYQSQIITTVSPPVMKPNTLIVSQILEKHKLHKESVFFVGDSITKDIATAQKIGIHDVWAKYGLTYRCENGWLLSQITPWIKGTGGTNELCAKPDPTYTILQFDDLKSIVTHMEG